MATLEHVTSGKRCTLGPHSVVGRAPTCAVRLETPATSGQHALIRWTHDAWELRDLNSRNGTYVGGRRLAPDERRSLARGDELAFGDPTEVWRMADVSGPVAALVPSDGEGAGAAATDGCVSVEWRGEMVSVHAASDGAWWLDRAGELSRLHDQAQVLVGGRAYRFLSPVGALESTAQGQIPFSIADHTLCFQISADEERVHLSALDPKGNNRDLGERACFYLLATLARARLSEPDPAGETAGWVESHELARRLGVDSNQINVDIYRVRKTFAQAGMQDSMGIVERRPHAKGVRIGTAFLRVERM